jgi:hypothetical protein
MVQIKIGNNEKQSDQNIEMTLKDGNLSCNLFIKLLLKFSSAYFKLNSIWKTWLGL